MDTFDGVSLLSILIIPAVAVTYSTAQQLYHFFHFYPTLTIYCSDNSVGENICNNFIKLAILSTVSFQISASAVCSIIIKTPLLPVSVASGAGISVGVVLFMLIWNILLLSSVTKESKRRLAFCWCTMTFKQAFLAYLIITVNTLEVGVADDLFTFSLLVMSVLVVFLDAVILCRSIIALHLFGKGFRSQVKAANESLKVKATRHNFPNSETLSSPRPLSRILLI